MGIHHTCTSVIAQPRSGSSLSLVSCLFLDISMRISAKIPRRITMEWELSKHKRYVSSALSMEGGGSPLSHIASSQGYKKTLHLWMTDEERDYCISVEFYAKI